MSQLCRHFEVIIYRPLWYHFIHIFSFVIEILLRFIDISYIKYYISVMVIYHIPNFMSIPVYVIIVIFLFMLICTLMMIFPVKNDCLSNISNINFMKFNYFHIPYFIKIIFYFDFPLSYLFIYIHIVYF